MTCQFYRAPGRASIVVESKFTGLGPSCQLGGALHGVSQGRNMLIAFQMGADQKDLQLRMRIVII